MAVQVSQLHDLVYRSFNRVDQEEGNGKEILGSAPARTSSSLGPPRQQGYQPPATKVFTEESPHQNQKRQEDIPIQRLTAAEMAARREKGLCYCCDEVYKFGHRCTKRQIFMFKEKEESDEETKEFVKEIKPPDSTIVTGLSQLQEVPVEASIDAKETKFWPKPMPNPNPNTKTAQSGHQKRLSDGKKHSNTFQTLTIPNQEYTEPIPIKRLTPTEARRDHTHNLHGLTFTTVKNRGSVQTSEFWPQLTKPPLHNFPKPRFMDSNRPNPWPNKLPIHINFDRPKPWPDDYPLTTVPKPRISPTTEAASQKLKQTKEEKPYQVRTKSVGQLRAFQVVGRNRDQFQHWNLPTTSRASAAVDFKLLLTVHINSWIVATLLTPFPYVDRLRSGPESQLMVLPVFDQGDFRSKEEEGKILFDCNRYLGHIGRILDEIQRRTKVCGRRFGERRRIGIVLEENRWRIEEEVTGLVKKKKLWFVEEQFGLSKKKKNSAVGCLKKKKLRIWI